MIVYPPRLEREGNELCLSARVESHADVPDLLWFRFDATHEPFVSLRADAFAAALALPAMALGEDLEIRGETSTRLAQGIIHYAQIFRSWFPRMFERREFRFDALTTARISTAQALGCAFSGGVDSTYSVWRRRQMPERGVTHAVFMHGFDISFEDTVNFQILRELYGPILAGIGIQLLCVRTNVKQFSQKAKWLLGFGSAVASAALVFGERLSTFLIPSTVSKGTGYPLGSHADTDPLLSTESLQIVHDGDDVTRFEKVEAIANWTAMSGALHCCIKRVQGPNNCSRCPTCVQTMTSLDTLGALPRFSTFSKPLHSAMIRATRLRTRHERLCARQQMERAMATGRPDLASDLQFALMRSVPGIAYSWMKGLISGRPWL